MEYNQKHGITPTTVLKSKEAIMEQTSVADSKAISKGYYVEPDEYAAAADPVAEYLGVDKLEKLKDLAKKNMEKAAMEMDFLMAAKYRDEMLKLEKQIMTKAEA